MTEFRTNDERLHAYLDDLLTPQQRAEFEADLRGNPDLRAALNLQRDVDQSLRRLFAPSEPTPLPQRAEEERNEAAVSTSHGTGRRILWALAASVVWIAILFGWWRSRPESIRFTARSLESIYDECVEAGFQPYWDCNDDPERFAATFASRQGTSLALGPLPPGCRMAGLSYLAGVSRATTAMLGTADGDPVIVFVDKLSNDRVIQPPSDGSGLHLFRKELGDLVLYEISPQQQPRFLAALQKAAATDE